MVALDEWTQSTLQDVLPPGALFAWDGGMRVVVGKLAAEPHGGFHPTLVLRFHADVLSLIGQSVTGLSRGVVQRLRTLVGTELARRVPAAGDPPMVIGLDLRSLGLDGERQPVRAAAWMP